MHLALCITEILSIIFCSLTDKELSRCARVCRAWFHPSVAILWDTVKNPRAFFEMLGPLEFNASRLTWNYVGAPSQAHWDSFHLYAQQIDHLPPDATLILHEGILHNMSSHTLEILSSSQYSGGCALFPHLRTLKFTAKHDIDGQLALLLNQPRLSRLHISFLYLKGTAVFKALAHAMLKVAPRLVCLGFADILGNNHLDWLTPLIPLFVKLETFSLQCQARLTPEAFVALSKLPRLRTLSIDDHAEINESQFRLDDRAFPQLVDIDLRRPPTPSFLSSLLQSPTFPWANLDSFRCAASGADLIHIVSKLSGSHSGTRTLRLIITSAPLPVYHMVLHIAELSHIRTLRILGVHRVNIQDADVKILADGLPELRTLTVDDFLPSDSPVTPSLTLRSLDYLLTQCLQLRRILLECDATALPPVEPALATPDPTQFLGALHLDVTSSPLDDPAAVATWLKPLCARFAKVEIRSEGGNKEGWAKVKESLNYDAH